MSAATIKGFKVTDANMQCLGYQYELNKDFKIVGKTIMCDNGFHFCELVNHCFNYYTFSSENRVFEVEAWGEIETQGDKSCSSSIKFIRELAWDEVLKLANTGIDNTGHSNSGDRNSGNRNSGNWNSGYSNSGNSNSGDSNSGNSNSGNRNSGDRNSGYRNSGDSNSGNSNSGNSNSGNWNSGYRNSGDSNSGYRNSGAFCTDTNSYVILFDKPTKIRVKDWENTEVVRIMSSLDTTLWIPSGMMSEDEKKAHPEYETTDGYLKTIPIKEAWANLWGKLDGKKKKLFTSLENFDAKKFEEITGINLKS